MKEKSTAAVRFIFVTIFLDALGIGFLFPVFPDVIRRFGSSPDFVSRYFGFFISIYALMQFFASPVLGSLSDRFGRRPILLVSLLGAGLDYIVMALAPNMGILFAGRIVSGLTGAGMTVASSYMADISNDKNRSANFGLIGAAFGLGFILGPGMGGILAKFGFQAPFYGAAFLNLLNFAWGYFFLPESLPPEIRQKMTLKRLNPFLSLMKILRASPILVLVWIYFLINLASLAHPSIWTLYTQYKFGWSAFQVGLSLSFVGLCIAIAQGLLTPIAISKFGENQSLRLGTIVCIVGFALFAFATKGWMMYAIMIVFAASGIVGPALQSMISKHVPPQEQGELQGSLMSMASLTSIIGPLFYTALFARFTSHTTSFSFPGVAYFAAAMICVLALLLWEFNNSKNNAKNSANKNVEAPS